MVIFNSYVKLPEGNYGSKLKYNTHFGIDMIENYVMLILMWWFVLYKMTESHRLISD